MLSTLIQARRATWVARTGKPEEPLEVQMASFNRLGRLKEVYLSDGTVRQCTDVTLTFGTTTTLELSLDGTAGVLFLSRRRKRKPLRQRIGEWLLGGTKTP